MDIEGQMTIWDAMAKEIPDEEVRVTGAINTKSAPMSEFNVTIPTGDLVLIVSMIEDYIRGLDIVLKDRVDWEHYYRKRYRGMSDRIQKAISYDYEKKREKCLKQKEKRDDDIGEEAIALTVKKAIREAAKKEEDQK